MPFDASWLRPPPADLAAAYRRQGYWTDEGLGEFVASGMQRARDQRLHIQSDVHPWAGTYGDVDRAARRLASALHTRGVRAGDIVVFQLPNWVEAGITFWACAYLGAVVVPVVHFYGPKELGYILDVSDPVTVVTADEFGHSDYLGSLEALLAGRAADWLVVRSTDRPLPPHATDFAALLDAPELAAPTPVDPDAPALIGFTSGTTRNPKGVIHSHRTIAFEARQLDAISTPTGYITGVPIGHMMGMLSVLLTPLIRPRPVTIIDVWQPGRVLDIMLTEGLAVGGGSPYFLTSLLDHPTFTDAHLPLMPLAGLGGSPVPVAVTERATRLGITAFRSYGSTEHPSTTVSLPSEPEDKRLRTDGHPLPGVEVRLDDDGQILSRGPDLFVGYTDPALSDQALDADGWYHTGDIGVLDDDGYLCVVDRISDVIIRGGENISALEVEDLLLELAGVAEVSVVAAPDARLGEHAAAVFRLHPAYPAPTMAEIRSHLASRGLARQKWPESSYVVPDFPRTPTGKVQKFRVREQVRTGSLARSDR